MTKRKNRQELCDRIKELEGQNAFLSSAIAGVRFFLTPQVVTSADDPPREQLFIEGYRQCQTDVLERLPEL